MAALDFPASPTVGLVATLTNGFSYQWDGAVWTLTPASPGQVAGGDLTGTYPNPTIAAGAVTWAKRGEVTYGRLTQHTLAVLTTGVAATLTFDTTEVAQGVSVAADRLTVPAAGFYMVGGSASFDRSGGGTQRLLQLSANGVVIAQQDGGIGTYAGRVIALGVFLGATSYIQLRAYQDSGANLALIGPDWPSLWLARVA
jgi:hypothetical protein